MTLAVIIGTIIVIIVTVFVGRFVQKKVGVELPRQDGPARKPPPSTYTLGETAASAFRVGDAQLAKLRTSQRCSECRAEMTYVDVEDDRVRYDRRDLLVLHFACPRCQTKRRLYVEHRV